MRFSGRRTSTAMGMPPWPQFNSYLSQYSPCDVQHVSALSVVAIYINHSVASPPFQTTSSSHLACVANAVATCLF